MNQPLLEIPPDRLPKGHTQESFHHHELGHAVVGITEGFKTNGIVSHNHFGLLKWYPNASGGVWWRDEPYVVSDPDGVKYSPEERLANSRKWATANLAGAAANELIDGITFKDNRGADTDLSRVRGLFEGHHGMTEATAGIEIAKAYQRAKEHLSRPGVLDAIREAARTRENGLDERFHYSEDRLSRISGATNERNT
jgi:hypothetical protein